MTFYTKFIEYCYKNNDKPYTVLSKIGIGSGNLASWKKGSIPNAYIIYDIAKYFGCRIEDLIEREYLKSERSEDVRRTDLKYAKGSTDQTEGN